MNRVPWLRRVVVDAEPAEVVSVDSVPAGADPSVRADLREYATTAADLLGVEPPLAATPDGDSA